MLTRSSCNSRIVHNIAEQGIYARSLGLPSDEGGMNAAEKHRIVNIIKVLQYDR